MKPRIITHHEFPPIPLRQFDWCAYRDGDEESGRYGWGPTEQAAIDDLLQLEADDSDEPVPEYEGPHININGGARA